VPWREKSCFRLIGPGWAARAGMTHSLHLGGDGDAELFRLWNGGDLEAGDALWRRMEPQLRRRAQRLVPRLSSSALEPEDLVQDAALVFLKRRLDPSADAPVRFLSVCMANSNSSRNRKRAVRALRAAADVSDCGDREDAAVLDPAEVALRKDLVVRLQQLLLEVDERKRRALVMRAVEQLSWAEIADELGWASEDAVRVAVTRLAEDLRRQLSR